MSDLSIEKQFQNALRQSMMTEFQQTIAGCSALELREKLMIAIEANLLLQEQVFDLKTMVLQQQEKIQELVAEKIGFTDYHRYKKGSHQP